MAVKASEIIQFLIVADQLMAAAVRLISQVREIEGADEPALQAQLEAIQKRNNQRTEEVMAQLRNIANGAPPNPEG